MHKLYHLISISVVFAIMRKILAERMIAQSVVLCLISSTSDAGIYLNCFAPQKGQVEIK